MNKFDYTIKYDFGSNFPQGITIYEAIKYQIAIELGLSLNNDFNSELETRFENMVVDAFEYAILSSRKYQEVENLLNKPINPIYSEDNTIIGDFYIKAIKYVNDKLYTDNIKYKSNIYSAYEIYLAASLLIDLLKSGKDDCSKYIDIISPVDIINQVRSEEHTSE